MKDVKFRVGVDIGGTFTDLVASSADGATFVTKVPTTADDQSGGFCNGLAALAEVIGINHREFLRRIDIIIHGTTVATNALLERRGAKVGLITTRGFIDVVEQMEGYKPERYNIRLTPHKPLIPRNLRIGVRERVRADGSTEIPLDEEDVEGAIRTLKDEKVEAISIALLHSYLQPAHERRIAEMASEIFPEAYLSLSSQVLPVMKEYQRFSTTVVNSYVGPILQRYLSRLVDRVRSEGYAGDILIMQSHGGLATIDASIRLAAGCVLSGPAGGVAGAVAAAKAREIPNLISFDMGGTSTDIALVAERRATISNSRDIEGVEVSLPAVDVHTIGSGGGSIALVGADGLLRVGPESAGSDPGPACYGQGGRLATTTDANLVLGYYDPDQFMGGRTRCDPDAARATIAELAHRLGCSLEEAASGILKIVGTQMAEGIRIVAVRAGRDPRRHALLSFGGAAGLHVAQIARNLEIRTVAIPPAASVFSAWGMLESDMYYERVKNVTQLLGRGTVDKIRSVIVEMEEELRDELVSPYKNILKIFIDMCYGAQIFELPVEIDRADLNRCDAQSAIGERFRASHNDLYGYAPQDQEIVVVNVRLSLTRGVERSATRSLDRGALATATSRRVYLEGGWKDVPIRPISSGGSDQLIKGPCILASASTSILLGSGDQGILGADGWITLDIAPTTIESTVDEGELLDVQ